MKQKIVLAIAALAVVALPVSAFAATYGYINTSGTFVSVVADSAAQALKTPDIDAHSGVILLKPGNSFGLVVTSASSTSTVKATTTSPKMATSSSLMATTTLKIGTSTLMMATTTATTTSKVATSTATTTAK